MNLQKKIKKVLNEILKQKGHRIYPIYKYNHLLIKNQEFVQETTNYFFSTMNFNIKDNDVRLKLLSNLYGTGIIEALFLIFYLNKSLKLKGDICEFGTANGATATLLANEIRKTTKKLWLYDSFEGLSAPTKEDKLINDIFNYKAMSEYKGSMSYSEKEVLQRLKDIKFPKRSIKLIKGFIDKTIIEKRNLPSKICFAYIDFDLYKPIITALIKIDDIVVKNGVIIIDDYNYFSSGVKTAVDEFTKNNKYSVILPNYSEGHFIILVKK